MKVKIPLVLLLIVAAVVGYVLGTENGRQQRDAVIVRFRKQGPVEEAAEAASDTAESVAETVADAVEAAAEAADPSDEAAAEADSE